MFISFEGIDGSGKSTQARLLVERLEAKGRSLVLTREPGGSEGAEEIRRLLVEGDPGRWSAETECLLFTAARRDHLEKVIQPALDRGDVVITDRFADSTRAYQGTARADLGGLVDRLHQEMIRVEPDVTIMLDIDPETALKRGLARHSGEDRFEEFGLEFQVRLRAAFLDLAERFADRYMVFDGSADPQGIADTIWTKIEERLS